MMKKFTHSILVCITLFFSLKVGAQNAYIPNNGDSSISIINTKTNTVIKTIHTPHIGPFGIVVSPDNSKVFVTNNTFSEISVINTTTNTIANTFTGIGHAGFIDISPDGSKLYYTSAGSAADTVWVINATNGNILSNILINHGTNGSRGIAVSPDGSKVYVAASSNVVVINTLTNTVSDTINTGANLLHGIAVSPDGSKLYVTDYFGGQVFVINTATNAISATIATGNGGFPIGVTVSPDGTKAYVSNFVQNNVGIINTATNTLVDTVTAGQGPFGLSLTPTGSLLYVANQTSNNVSVINTVTNTLVTTIPVGPGPIAFGKFIATAVQNPPPSKLGIKSFAIFAGDSTASLTDSVRYGVEIASSVLGNISIIGGAIGSNSFVRFTNPVSPLNASGTEVGGDIYGNTVSSFGGLRINGNISVLNKNSATFNTLNADSVKVGPPGNIYVNGNTFLGSNSSVTGKVQIPAAYTYAGPVPGGGIDSTTPVFPQMPDLPAVSNYAVPTGANITSTQTIVPGSYGNIILNGGDTITFSGVGTYVFAGANITNANNFVYDFKNNITGGIRIIFTQDASLGALNASMINGGSAARIFTEAKGRGTVSNNFTAFALNTQGTFLVFWLGTVYAPYGAIAGGYLTTEKATLTSFTGCLWSGTKVTLGVNAYVNYIPPAVVSEILPVTDIIPYYPAPADGKVNTILGAELTSLYENRNTITTDSIIYHLFGNEVLIDVVVKEFQESDAFDFLVANGFHDQVSNGEGSRIITGKFPIENLLILNTRPDLFNFARPLYFPLNNSGVVQSQGDTSIQSDFVRKAYGLTGQGVKVGVLSDSYNSIPGDYASIDVANGDLPGPGNPNNHLQPVQVLSDYPYGQSIDEGRAMLEIIHDVAPGASLAFRSGFTSPGDFAQGISELQLAGCNVIVDDITFITEPYFKDGVVAQAVNNAVAAGSTYFSAAGNFGLKSYEGDFSGITAPATLSGISVPVHDFGSGNPLQAISLQPGNYTIVLQWDDAIYSNGGAATGAATDLDIYLVDQFGSTLFGFNRNNLGGDPIEVFPFTVRTATTANLLIAKAAGPNVHFKYIVFRGDLTINGYPGSSTLVGQANSAGAIAVGAAFYRNTPPYNVNPPTISSFSSVGGTIVEGSVRNKPEIVAAQGINTTVEFGSVDYEPDNFPNFFGTSAAAPHAAAAAALIIEGQQKFIAHTITPAETRTLLENTALDMNTPGFDAVTGYGFVQPMAAMQTFAAPRPIIIALQTNTPVVRPVSAAFTVIVKGKFLTPQTLVYLRGVPISTNFLNTDSVSAVIPAFTDNPVVQLYNPPISSSLLDGGFSDSLYFFPKKLITIKANDQTKKYGEALPAFTSTITVDGVPLSNTSLTPADLKLDPVLYTSSANTASNIATYFIHPYAVLDPHDPVDSLLLATYTYQFIDGLLKIKKLPVKISPRDTTLVYGQQIHGIHFNYVIDPSAHIGNKDSLISTIQFSHTSAIVDSIYVLASKSGATSRPLVNSDLDGLGVLISNHSGATSRPLVNNASGTSFTSYVVDVDNQSIFNYQADPSSSPLVNSKGATSRALVNTGPLVNGTATVVVNGAGATSRALVNGNPLLLNSTTTGTDSISNIAVIVSSDDAPDATTNRIFTEPVNLVTGITVGQNIIAPAAFLSGNFEVTYGLGHLTITPAPLDITANPASTSNGELPPFSATINGFQYDDSASSPRQGPQFTVLPAYTGNPGTYAIRPSALTFPADTNYSKRYVDGVLTVLPYQNTIKPIILKLKCIQSLCGDNTSKFRYVAHFYYENKNDVPVTIPIGINNKITSEGPYKGNQPSVFNPGINYVDFYFNGEKLTWCIVTPNSGKFNRSEATATWRSPKCDDDPGTTDDIYSKNSEGLNGFSFYKLYPNPARNTLWLSGNFEDDQKTITIIAVTGVEYKPKIKSRTAHLVEIDISALPKGLYFIRIQDKCHINILPFIKL